MGRDDEDCGESSITTTTVDVVLSSTGTNTKNNMNRRKEEADSSCKKTKKKKKKRKKKKTMTGSSSIEDRRRKRSSSSHRYSRHHRHRRHDRYLDEEENSTTSPQQRYNHHRHPNHRRRCRSKSPDSSRKRRSKRRSKRHHDDHLKRRRRDSSQPSESDKSEDAYASEYEEEDDSSTYHHHPHGHSRRRSSHPRSKRRRHRRHSHRRRRYRPSYSSSDYASSDNDQSSKDQPHHHHHRRRRRRRRDDEDDENAAARPEEEEAQAPPKPVSDVEDSDDVFHDSSSKDIDDSYGHFEGGPGTVIHNRYTLVRDVGMGTFGRVVEAVVASSASRHYHSHHHHHGHRHHGHGHRQAPPPQQQQQKVAIKIVRNVKRYQDSAWIEADIVQNVNSRGGRGRSLVAVLLDRFDWKGHACLVFECLGPSLYDFLKHHDYRPFPLYCVRHFATQLLNALEFIHSFGLIHTDLKPENILLTNPHQVTYRHPVTHILHQVPASTNIKVIDFGGATYDYEKKSSVINTRQYRAPEVILGLGWSMPSDLWSAGCIIAELYMGELLFATHDNTEHLALMERAIGRFPLDLLAQSRQAATHNNNNNNHNNNSCCFVFDSYGWHKMNAVLSPSSLSHVRKMGPLESLVADHDKPSGLVHLLRSLLTIDPNMRSTAKQALQKSQFCSTYQHNLY